MQQIHDKLMQNSKSYATWHEHPHHHKFHWGIALLVAIAIGIMLLKGVAYWKDTMFNTQEIKLTMEPQTRAAKVGETFKVDIILDTGANPVDGVDIYDLHYDPTILSVVDDVATVEGVQIMPGNLMAINALNTVDQATGTIRFSQAAIGGSNYNGEGVLASIHFKAVKKGSAYLKFDFDLGSTKDTNAAHGGRDRLLNVVDGLYTVTD